MADSFVFLKRVAVDSVCRSEDKSYTLPKLFRACFCGLILKYAFSEKRLQQLKSVD
jgi:hypothetical protein